MANDTWRTPLEVFAYYDASYSFVCDVAASHKNNLCTRYFDEEYCGIDHSWTMHASSGDHVWLNPPYSDPKPFIKKAIDESKLNGIGSVILLNHDMSVEWASLLVNINCDIQVFIASGSKENKDYHGGRMSFLNAEGKPTSGNSKGQFVAIIPPYVRNGIPTTTYISLGHVIEIGRVILNSTVNTRHLKAV